MTKKEELEAQGYKTYENEDIQVFWKPRICQHAGECEFEASGDRWVIMHTGVREAYEARTPVDYRLAFLLYSIHTRGCF